jgi:hypothetical protein
MERGRDGWSRRRGRGRRRLERERRRNGYIWIYGRMASKKFAVGIFVLLEQGEAYRYTHNCAVGVERNPRELHPAGINRHGL